MMTTAQQRAEYESSWVGAPTRAPAPAVAAVEEFASAWHDDEAGPLEKAVRAAGVVPPVAPQSNRPDEARKAVG